MAKAKAKKHGKKKYCVTAGKKTVSCHLKKSTAKKVAKARRHSGRKARIVSRAR